jgi:hypothetical protein
VHADAGEEDVEAEPMMPLDVMLSIGTAPISFASGSQTSRVSQSEFFISGGTGDVFWTSTNERGAAAFSSANMIFQVDAPTVVRIRYDLTIDATSFRSWTGSAGFRIAQEFPIVSISASTISDQGMGFSPSDAFDIGADGYARTVFDEVATLLPGNFYEFHTYAASQCPGATLTDTCVGKPISFTTHLQVIPEPSTWLAALLATLVLSCHRRFQS